MTKGKKTMPPVVLPILVAGVFGLAGSVVGGERRIVPLNDSQLLEELQEYVSLLDGEEPPLTDSGFENVGGLEWRRSIHLDPYACVMLGLSAAASDFSIRHQVPSATRLDMRNALSFCAEGEEVSVDFVATFEAPPRRIYFEEHRAAPHRLNLYTIKGNFLGAAYLGERWPRELIQRAAYARELNSSGELLSGPFPIGPENTALLLPHDEQMMRVLQESSFLGLPLDRDVDFRVQGTTGEVVGTVTPSVRVQGTLRPLVVAIDPRENTFCTIVEIWPTLAADLTIGAITHPGAVVTPDIGNRIVVCPENGVALIYATPASYEVSVRRGRDAESETREHVAMTMSLALRELIVECEDGNGGACRGAASRFETGVGAVPDLERAGEFIERACDLGASYCFEAAGFLFGDEQDAALLRACDEGERGDACALLGARRRLGEDRPANYANARALYQRACELGAAGACDDARHMFELELTNEEEVMDAAIALGFVEFED